MGEQRDADETDRLLQREGAPVGRVSEFISSLFEILNNDAMSQWIKWCNGGKALHVVDPQGFHANVSRIYWRQSSFGSFSRQLHMYGFKRTYEDVGTGQYKYFHESFQQSKREWLPLVSREVPPRKPYKRPLEEYRDSEAGGDDMHWAPQQAAVHRAAQLAAFSHRLCHLECSVVSQLSLLQQKLDTVLIVVNGYQQTQQMSQQTSAFNTVAPNRVPQANPMATSFDPYSQPSATWSPRACARTGASSTPYHGYMGNNMRM